MLMKTPRSLVYLSADELGITERERAGLIEVRDDLASGRVKHAPNARGGCHFIDPNAAHFSMMYWNSTTDCGTAHCIGGFMQSRGWLGDGSYSVPLGPLFYPEDNGSYEQGVEGAVRAIDHFLAGAGRDCWPLALADEPA